MSSGNGRLLKQPVLYWANRTVPPTPWGFPEKGVQVPVSEDFVAALYDDFQDHGSAAIAACRAEKPDVYVRVIASLLPRDVSIKVQELDDLTDDQLMRKLQMVTKMAKPPLAKLPEMIDVTPAPLGEPRVLATQTRHINSLARFSWMRVTRGLTNQARSCSSEVSEPSCFST